jgi:hypothetical protein
MHAQARMLSTRAFPLSSIYIVCVGAGGVPLAVLSMSHALLYPKVQGQLSNNRVYEQYIALICVLDLMALLDYLLFR